MPSPRGGSCSASLAKGAMQAVMVIYRNSSGLRSLRLRKPLFFYIYMHHQSCFCNMFLWRLSLIGQKPTFDKNPYRALLVNLHYFGYVAGLSNGEFSNSLKKSEKKFFASNRRLCTHCELRFFALHLAHSSVK